VRSRSLSLGAMVEKPHYEVLGWLDGAIADSRF
jgi:hypothetical protein